MWMAKEGHIRLRFVYGYVGLCRVVEICVALCMAI